MVDLVYDTVRVRRQYTENRNFVVEMLKSGTVVATVTDGEFPATMAWLHQWVGGIETKKDENQINEFNKFIKENSNV